ncbi:MAG: hypothetical protein OXF02_08000 [Simkaniaceae bacterium]|nr:hypothetical protein [Simkaniaceae bacterium]
MRPAYVSFASRQGDFGACTLRNESFDIGGTDLVSRTDSRLRKGRRGHPEHVVEAGRHATPFPYLRLR